MGEKLEQDEEGGDSGGGMRGRVRVDFEGVLCSSLEFVSLANIDER